MTYLFNIYILSDTEDIITYNELRTSLEILIEGEGIKQV